MPLHFVVASEGGREEGAYGTADAGDEDLHSCLLEGVESFWFADPSRSSGLL